MFPSINQLLSRVATRTAAAFVRRSREKLRNAFNSRIYTGPFCGLKIPQALYDTLSVAEILGLYESCLHPVFSRLCNRRISNIVIVGGNYGYYTAGLSYMFQPQGCRVYEMAEGMHAAIRSWFIENDLQEPLICGVATSENLRADMSEVDLLFIDCEGGEVDLLDPESCEWLMRADIVVELHPFYVDNLLSTLLSRFAATHRIELIYDDFAEDSKIIRLLQGVGIRASFPRHPTHRWIIADGSKRYTAGMFAFLQSTKHDYNSDLARFKSG